MSTDYSKMTTKALVDQARAIVPQLIAARPGDILNFGTDVSHMTLWAQGQSELPEDQIREVATGLLRARDEIEAAKKEAEGGK
ncbi:MAG TPA: hypothetical protein VFZ48_05210 [Candidatus Saccharimonadales bacterium]